MAKRVEVDPYEALRVLFLRRYERQLACRADVNLRQGEGRTWVVEVSSGSGVERQPPAQYRKLAVQAGLVDQPLIVRAAEASTPDKAIAKLRGELAAELACRIRSDVGALEIAGHPFDWDTGGARVVDAVAEEVREPLVIDVVAEPPALPPARGEPDEVEDRSSTSSHPAPGGRR